MPTDSTADDVLVEVETADATQSLSLVDGQRISSDVEHIYQAGTQVSLEGDVAYSHVFDSWGGGTHEITGQVTGAVISPYIGGWARPGQVFLGLDLDARDDTGVDDDITDLQLEPADGTTVTPENDFSSLRNRFVETAWFQVPAASEQITLHVLPKAKAGTQEIDFESPVEVQLTIEGVPTTGGADSAKPDSDRADSGDEASATEGPASSDESSATQEPGSTD